MVLFPITDVLTDFQDQPQCTQNLALYSKPVL